MSIRVNRVLVNIELDLEGEVPADLQDKIFAALEPIGAAGLAVEVQNTNRVLYRPAPPASSSNGDDTGLPAAAAAELPAPPGS